jgi:DNA-binding GntR family transcriptional regulator
MSMIIEPPEAEFSSSGSEDPNQPSSGLRSLAEDAYERILAEILSGDLSPTEDEPSSEIALQRQYEFSSRMPIRMALAVLAAEGLIAQRARHGFWVIDYTDHDLKQIGAMRADADAMVASFLAARISDETITTDSEAFQPILESQGQMEFLARNAPQDGPVGRGVEMAFADHDTRFHTFIAAATEYTLAARHIRQWRNLIRLYRVRHDLHYTRQDLEAICAEHATLIELVGRDPERYRYGIDAMIEQAATSHVANSLRRCNADLVEQRIRVVPAELLRPLGADWSTILESLHPQDRDEGGAPAAGATS